MPAMAGRSGAGSVAGARSQKGIQVTSVVRGSTTSHLGGDAVQARSSPSATTAPSPRPEPADRSGLRAAIAHEADPLRVMRRVADAALVLVEHADGSVIELDDHRGSMAYVCASGSLKPFEGLQVPIDGSLSGLALRSGAILRCDDSEADPRVDRAACRRVDARALVCVPLTRDSETVGVLKVAARQPNVFSEGDVAALESLSEFVAVAIGGARDLVRTSDRVLAERRHASPARSDESMARFVANVLRPSIASDVAVRSRIEHVLANRRFETVFQPIVDVNARAVAGVEALTRFPTPPQRPPDAWFADAHAVGLGVDLEVAAAEAALGQLDRLPAPAYMSVNASPEVLRTDAFSSLCAANHPDRIVVELTEHVVVDDYPDLLCHIQQLRRWGVRLAIDDTGAGISSLAHILKLAPDVIKLDRSLTAGIDADPARRALATALVAFGAEMGARIVAEGVESAGELAALSTLGVVLAQGYHLGRPAPLPPRIDLLHLARDR